MMRPLSAAELLDAWNTLRPSDRWIVRLAALLERALADDVVRDDLAAASVGQRDAWLLELRELEFGPGSRPRGRPRDAAPSSSRTSTSPTCARRSPTGGVAHRGGGRDAGDRPGCRRAVISPRWPTSTTSRTPPAALLERCIVSDPPTLEGPGRERLGTRSPTSIRRPTSSSRSPVRTVPPSPRSRSTSPSSCGSRCAAGPSRRWTTWTPSRDGVRLARARGAGPEPVAPRQRYVELVET